ncbi:SBBP repeat-containing protein, partial [Candidatus Latescibacterota bacterium]
MAGRARRWSTFLSALSLAPGVVATVLLRPDPLAASPHTDQPAPTAASVASLPLSFEPNCGQTDDRVRFLSRGKGYVLFLTPDSAVLSLGRSPSGDMDSLTTAALHLHLLGAAPHAAMAGVDEQPGKSHYFLGQDPSGWRTHVPRYGKVRCQGVYPGVDVVYYGTDQRRLEYDFVVAPGADPDAIRLRFDGADDVRLADNGDLVVSTPGGHVVFAAPVAYQQIDGARHEVASSYVLGGHAIALAPTDSTMAGCVVSFELGEYQSARPLVIDPVLLYSSYMGGSGSDTGCGIGVDDARNVYFAGTTSSADFPITASPLQGTYGATSDGFVAKMNADATALLYVTYLGGSASDAIEALAVDGAGNTYVAGWAMATDFPVANALQPAHAGGGYDAVVARLSPDGSSLVYSTYLGGSTSAEFAYGIALDGSGAAVVVGKTASTDFPTSTPVQAANEGSNDAFVAKLSADGSALVYSTYLGGSGDDISRGVAVDGSGNAFVAGETTSADFPVSGALQPDNEGGTDAFVTKLDAAGTTVVFSTYLGGTGADYGNAIAVDGSGDAYVTGTTQSSDFPTTESWDQTLSGPQDAFITKLSGDGTARTYSTYLGGVLSDGGTAIAVDGFGRAHVAGTTFPTGFPVVDAFQTTWTGGLDVFVSMLSPDGSALEYSCFMGGSLADYVYGIAVDALGVAHIVGKTGSTDLPTASPLQASNAGGDNDILLARVAVPLSPVTSPTANDIDAPTDASISATFTDAIDGATPDPFTVHGSQTGPHAGTYSGAGTAALSLDPSTDVAPGERVTVTLAGGLQTQSGLPTTKHVWQYTAAAAAGPVDFAQASSDFGSGSDQTYASVLGDLDGDGDLDIAAADNGGQNSTYANSGSGTFATGSSFGSGSDASTSLVVADLDGDGDLDIAAGNYGEPNITYINDGAGAFAAGNTFGTGTDDTRSVAAGDADADGDLDLAVGNVAQQHQACLNDGSGDLGTCSSFGIPIGGALGLAFGDLDGDGDLDLASGNDNPAMPSFAQTNDGNGGYAVVLSTLGAPFPTQGLAVGDADGDGDLDIVMGLDAQFNIVELNTDGAGTFLGDITWFGTGTDASMAVALGDVDGDGDLDCAVGNVGEPNTLHLNDGSANYGAGISFGTGADATYGLVFGDVDGDGDLDLVAANAGGQNVVYRDQGTGLTESTVAAGLSGASTISAGGGEVRLYSIGLTGDGSTTVSSVALTVSDLSTATGLVAGDFSALNLYRSTDATLDGSDTAIGSEATVNVGAVTTVAASTPDLPPNGAEAFYLVSAVVSSTVGHAFKVGSAAGGVTTSAGGIGTAVTASDADYVTIVPAVPVLLALSGATQPTNVPTLDWGDAAGAASYTLEYADNAGFTGSTTVSGLAASAHTFPAVMADGTYWWRVKSVGAGALESGYCASDSFVIIPTFTESTMAALACAMAAALVWYGRRRTVRSP